jgi:hypothetical protein
MIATKKSRPYAIDKRLELIVITKCLGYEPQILAAHDGDHSEFAALREETPQARVAPS